MLAVLTKVPQTDQDWAIWSLHHRVSHDVIRQALAAQGVQTTEYLLDPIFSEDIGGFLQRNASAHQEMLAPLGIAGQDLLDVDFNDQQAKAEWVNLHWMEHVDAETALNVNS